MPDNKLTVDSTVWRELMNQLKVRGNGERETGAFLLGNKTRRTITSFVCYDDLDPQAFASGIIIFNGDGYIPLWQLCADKGLRVLADVHTHPGNWTGQSASDRRHPMIVQKGHIALIVPNYALGKKQLLHRVGIYEFLGEGKWKTWEDHSKLFTIV